MPTPTSTLQRQVFHQPFSAEDVAAIQQELQSILASSYFRNSRRYPAFLNYVVEIVLQGKHEEIKERSIGVEVFGRPPDYDTNHDPVVRNTAGEVRKRLIVYYSERPYWERRVEISLHVGTYVPEFALVCSQSVPEEEAPPASPLIAPVSDYEHASPAESAAQVVGRSSESLAASPYKKPERILRGFSWLSGFVLIAALALVSTGYLWRSTGADQVLWSGFFNSRRDVLIVVPEASLPDGVSSAWTEDNHALAMEDLSAVTSAAGLLMKHNVPYRIKLDQDTTLADLTDRPVILIGGVSNTWTMTFIKSLRYQFKPAPGLYIEDTRDISAPACLFETRKAKNGYPVIQDCAIIARFDSKLTADAVMIIAGSGRSGTQAAGEWIASPSSYSMMAQALSGDWRNKNVEVVLQTKVIGWESSAPTIVRAFSW